MTVTRPIKTLLVANRGEIALRVFRTCAELGIRTVAIHTAVDADAPHVREADVRLEVASYLDVDAVVAAAKEAGADAVHPGYGFLSERSVFARALADAGITLVGPSAEVMDAMGRKDAAREVAVAAGVPVIPAYDIDDDPATFAYPVLVKAAAGGGGKGMRVVRSAADFAEARAAAAREGLNSFGDDTLLVEKYVESGRHIEVQVMADHHGTVRHLFERDCSTQRRHQKVLEEAPAPTISGAQREAITASAVALAAQVGYTNAGTVEFLLDTEANDGTGAFYFLEMNTRLQVEHPVTEEVVRVRGEKPDLVAMQIAVAAGERLDFDQSDVTLEGHAIEGRLYAEDSFGGFLPQAGTASYVHWGGDEDIRLDVALESGQEVSTQFDPMLGKIIAVGADREAARRALVEELDETVVLGLTTNAGFLRALLETPEFAEATIDTAWLDRHEVAQPDPAAARRLAAAMLSPRTRGDAGPFAADGWRIGGTPAPRRVRLDEWVEVPDEVHVSEHVTVSGPLWLDLPALPMIAIDAHGEEAVGFVGAGHVEVVHRGQRHVFALPDPFADAAGAAGGGTLTAPMPGTVLEVVAAVGDTVEAGQVLGMMEAMKMELSLKAPFAGTVTEVGAGVGDLVGLGATLFVVEPAEEDAS
ncbi:ATP-grasp domain-containing protein [Nocardioides sp. Y6]|uniref:ATP-grasp domain-containing protein n=1 Tax=Nocardioides malaquae TaxID=2773426 RepID=A0ABR9RSI9_9ACTN|nr:biotin carboxylase N-terminal domain-containing protein [Nocardioides malaquae]MBE7324548.1 ATP-grasp domain-containing protein [Nocardioides malaquae]